MEQYYRNPFIDESSKKQLPAVDEFSKLTDELNWSKEQKAEFVRSLSNEKQNDPITQFEMTGFNNEMTGLREESSPNVIFFSLSLCEFSSTRPLLKCIVDRYTRKKDVPMLLFETVKSTPGLVGLWAERVFRLNFLDRSLADFVNGLQWIHHVIEDSVSNNDGDGNVTTSPNTRYAQPKSHHCTQLVFDRKVPSHAGE